MFKAPEALMQPLRGADGSASYSANGYSVLAAVNGPIEVQRRDELPDRAAIDVIIRPAIGVGSVRERHFETIIQHTLRHVIITNEYPRTQIQVILQITATPEMIYTYGKTPHAASGLEILPALLHAALLALLSTAIPMRTIYSACIVAESNEHRLILNPSLNQLRKAPSVHVIAMSKSGKCLVIESEGQFNMDILEAAIEIANEARGGGSGSIVMDDAALGGLESFIQSTVDTKVMADEKWRDNVK